MTNDEKIAALEREVAELKAKVSPAPAKKEFVPKPYQRYDPTEGMRMPPSALAEMAGHPCNQVMRDVIQDRHAPTSPGSMIPSTGGSAGDGTGYVDPRPLSPPPGVAQADRLMDAQDRRDRIELAHRIAAHEAAMRAARKG
jgi:hypothetical protein